MKHATRPGSGPGWLGLAASALALLSCYGTLAAVALLSALGIAFDPDEGIWAAAIALFTLLTIGAVALGYRRHHNVGPTILAVLGAGPILWTLFARYAVIVELTGFAALAAAAIWGWWLGRAQS